MSHESRFTLEKIESRLCLIEPLVIRRRSPLGSLRYFEHKDASEPAPIGTNVDVSDWITIEPNTHWGKWNVNFTLRGEFTVPADWNAKNIGLEFNFGKTPNWDFAHPEALLYIDEQPIASVDRNHTLIYLPEQYRDGKTHEIAMCGYTGRWFVHDRIPENLLFMETNSVVQIDQATRDFVATLRVAVETARRIPSESPARGKIISALDEAFKQLDTMHPMGDAFYTSVGPVHRRLKEQLHEAGSSLDVTVNAIGHSHIDVAWLWSLAQTRRKCGRTFHTALSLMDEFDDYLFTQSQPQLYDYVRQDYPELFSAIQKKVQDGKWEPLGGMWVEADCNLAGAESLARQFLLGRQFYAEHFGASADSPVLWLPDVFGYCGNLPQLIKQAGMDYFFTTKLSWNQYNKMPYDSFLWQGIDGTQVLTHLATTRVSVEDRVTPYGGEVTPNEIYNTWASCEPKELHSELMTCYGYSDGGGGPTREMLENIREMAGFPGLPKVKTSKVIDFFKKLEHSCGDNVPVWNGELYLEYHRGTYTTHGRNKRANRKSEFGLHDTEFLNCLAAQLDGDYSYPHDQLKKAWELVCLNQFHDIIPGTSVPEVYVDSLKQYEQVGQIIDDTKQKAMQRILQKTGGDIILINPTSFVRNDIALLKEDLDSNQQLKTIDGKVVDVQKSDDGTVLDTPEMMPYSVLPLRIMTKDSTERDTGLSASQTSLENKYLKVNINADGDIIGIFDKVNRREIVPEGSLSNQMLAFEDRPLKWDAWDVDIFYDDKTFLSDPAESVELIESGPLRAIIEIKRKILDSHYTQRISLAYNSPRLDIETTIDWQQRSVLLKAAFPVNILSTQASFDIQWGQVKRPTHHNTSWDWARFESCAHKWVDLSEDDYGVSLLNDCKYGHDIKDNVIRITLLRGSVMPDPEADKGVHTFTYSIFPHSGPVGDETIKAAYSLNDPLLTCLNKSKSVADPEKLEFIRSDQSHAVIETIKKAEDDNGFIVRLYESQCRRGPVTLSTRFAIKSCCRTNLLEENLEAIQADDKHIELNIKPFEIINLRIIPQ